MSKSTINVLPNELLIEIFRRVDRLSLKNAILTCKLWKALIESSCSWSCVLHHNIPLTNILLTSRKFHTIQIDGFKELGNSSIIEIFRRLGRNVTTLFINRTCLDKCDIFIELLKCVPNLKHLILHVTNTKWNVSDIPPVTDLPQLMQLETLETFVCEAKIIKCIASTQLKTIKFQHFGGHITFWENDIDVEHQPIIDLLRSQQQLTALALRSIGYYLFQLFHTDILDEGMMPFQLTKLSLLDFNLRENSNDYNNLVKFMKQHTNTIKELELGRNFPKSVYEFVFGKFTNLKSLRLKINELPEDMVLEENRSINNLILIDFPPLNHACPPALEKLLRHVPNVNELTLLESGDCQTMLVISKALTQLNKLNVNKFTEEMCRFMKFPQLTSLNIHKLDERIYWGGLTSDNSGITELTIEIVSNNCLDSNAIEEITGNLNLKTLKIGNGFSTKNKHFYDAIRKNCLDLEILQLPTSCAIEYNIRDVPGLRFYDTNLSRCCDGFEPWTDSMLSDDNSDFFDQDYFESEDDTESDDDFDP